MRYGLFALAVLAAIPAWADSHFRVTPTPLANIPLGKGQCEIRLKVDDEVEVRVRRDTVTIHTVSGHDAQNDGSECNASLPGRDVRGFAFQVVQSRNEMRMLEPPSAANDYTVVVKIRDTASGAGHYQFRLSWDDMDSGPEAHRDLKNALPSVAGPAGFIWNNVLTFRGHGAGDSRLNDESGQALTDVTVNIDQGGRMLVTFVTAHAPKEKPRQVVFTGTLMVREENRVKGDMITEDHRLRGPMTMLVDDRQNVNKITLDATNGQDRLHLTWERQ